MLLLPASRQSGSRGRLLACFWQGLWESGWSQAANGGYSAFRLLVRKEALVAGKRVKGSGDFQGHQGEFMALVQAPESCAPLGGEGCKYLVLATGASREKLISLAVERGSACLVVSISVVGFPDGGGVASGLRVAGSAVSFLAAPDDGAAQKSL